MKSEISRIIYATRLFFALSQAIPHVIALADSEIIQEKFEHDMHSQKVFKPLSFECSKCHNFSLDSATGKLLPSAGLEHSSFRVAPRQMCHQCHQSTEPRFQSAPKTCFTCHADPSLLSAIKPLNHANVAWKREHALEARVEGGQCTQCHTHSQCAKCHTQRNDIVQRNHPRNFRVTHSIQARLQPHRCDACHTKTYCSNCHLGVR